MRVSLILKKSAKGPEANTAATLYARLKEGAQVDLTAPTQLTVDPGWWDERTGQLKSRAGCDEQTRSYYNDEARKLKAYLEKNCRTAGAELSGEWLEAALDKYYHPKKHPDKGSAQARATVVELFGEFLLRHRLSEVRAKNFRVVQRGLQRYEAWVRATRPGQPAFRLLVDEVTPETLRDIWTFFENEHTHAEHYPALYGQTLRTYTPRPRGKNTLIDCFGRLRTFFHWCHKNKKTRNKPFENFRLDVCTYGSPVYISLEERDRLYDKDLSKYPSIEAQRDIFVFQSLIGCRVGDLYRMSRRNVIDGAIEYIPRKTKEGHPVTVRVPLNAKAQAILKKYAAHDGDRLFPFISMQKYNETVKRAFRLAGLDRMVTILDPLSGQEVKRPLYQVASSHMARRTFIGNIYKRVKDPDLVGALSGHKEGSRAFARYREIDEEIKKELVELIG